MAGKQSAIEKKLAFHIHALKLPQPVEEYQFHPERKWRFDFAWPELRIAAECEGAVGIRSTAAGKVYSGRHTSKAGFEADLEKYNEAVLLGWDVVRFSADTVTSGRAAETLERLIKLKRELVAAQDEADLEVDIPGARFDGTLGELVDAIGLSSSLHLIRRLGGAEYYVPRVPKPGHPLTLAIGVSACNRLCARFAGDKLEIPTRDAFRDRRDQVIGQALDRGTDPNVLAAQFGLTRRHLRNIRARFETLAAEAALV